MAKFTKAQILNSKRYADRRDVLSGLLKNDRQYSHEQVKRLIDDFMRGKVK